MMYFLLTSSEDGVRVRRLTKAQLENALVDEQLVVVDYIPDTDHGCWLADERTAVIIKGEIVTPTPKDVVRSYDIP